MNTDEINNEYKLSIFQYDLRCSRLKRFYEMNAAEILIEKGIELIQEAGKRITLYSLPYNEMMSKLPEQQGAEILKNALQNVELDEFDNQINEKWEIIKKSYLKKYPNQLQMIDEIIADLKEKTLMVM